MIIVNTLNLILRRLKIPKDIRLLIFEKLSEYVVSYGGLYGGTMIRYFLPDGVRHGLTRCWWDGYEGDQIKFEYMSYFGRRIWNTERNWNQDGSPKLI